MHVEQLEALGVFNLGKSRLCGDMLGVCFFQYLKYYVQVELFKVVSKIKTRNNQFKLQGSRFWLDVKKHFLRFRAVQQLNRLPREMEELFSLEII